MNILKQIKFTHHLATGTLTYLTYYTIWLEIQDKKELKVLKNQVAENKAVLDKYVTENEYLKEQIAELKAETVSLSTDKFKILETYKLQLTENDKLIEVLKNKLEFYKNSPKPVNPDEVINTINETTDKIQNNSTIINEAMKIWENTKNQVLGGDFIQNILENIKLLLSQLNFEQLLAISHIFSSIFILLCLVSIITIIYSDYLLNYLKIEEKYPRLGKIIRFRRAYQQYYLILNLLLIIITLLATMYIDYSILIL